MFNQALFHSELRLRDGRNNTDHEFLIMSMVLGHLLVAEKLGG